MSESNIVGSISKIQGNGNIVIIRSSDESFIAQEGDVILANDTVITSSGASVTISINSNNLDILQNIDTTTEAVDELTVVGVVNIGNAQTVSFFKSLFDEINSLLPDSSLDNPVSIGKPLTPEVTQQFREVLSSSAEIQTANDQSQTDTIIDSDSNLEQIFTVPSAGEVQSAPFEGIPDQFVNVKNAINERLPDSEGIKKELENSESEPLITVNTDSIEDIIVASATVNSVSAASTVEGEQLVHTITLSDSPLVATTFSFNLTGISAANSDFSRSLTLSDGVTLNGDIITVPAGVSSFTVIILTTNDTIDESNETISLSIGGVTTTSTIEDNDSAPTISSITSESETEGNNLVHTVTLSNESAVATTFSFTLVGNTASGSDFTGTPTFSNGVTLSSGNITVPAGVTSFTVTIPTINDLIDEVNETIDITIDGLTATGTIIDNDGVPTITSVTSDSETEGTDLVHTVTLSNESAVATTFSFTLAGNTASGTDFSSTPTFSNGVTLSGGNITVPAGVTSFTVTVPTTNDTIDESDETIDLTVGGVAATGTIEDNDSAPTISSVSTESETEGTDLVHTVTLSNESAVATTFSFTLAGNTASGTDFTSTPTFSNGVTLSGGNITVPAGVTSFTVTVPTTNDTIDESDETIDLTVGGVAATGTIEDNDSAPTISSVTSESETEGTDLVHTVTLSNESAVATTFSFTLAGNTASGTDFTGTPTFSNGVTLSGGNITVPAGVTSFTVTVSTTNDTIDESDETIDLTVGGVAATGTIEDNDSAPTISSVTSESETEGTDLVHTVTLSNESAVATTFSFTLAGNTASGTDFTGTPTFSNGVTLSGGNITVPAGVTSFTVTVPTTNDTIDESDETIDITVGGVAATGTIEDNDSAPTISSVSTESETEGTDLVHTVTLSNESAVATTFSFTLAGNTASGTDFTGTPTFSNGVTLSGGNITVPAGVTSFTVTVSTTNDTIDESDETIDLTVGGVAATGTIEDNDSAPTISSVTSESETEGTDLVHTVTLSNESAVATTFSFTLAGNTAAGTDFTGTPTFSNEVTLSGGNITVPAGVTSFTVTIPTTNDTIDESDETIDLTVGGVTATSTIEDNDSAPTISSVTSESETEGTDLVHTVTLSNESAVATTFSFTLAGNTAAGTDFTSTPIFSNGVTLSGGNITVPAGVTSFTVTVPTTNDTIDESDEIIDITVGGVAATGTIEDNDAAPTISSVTSESETEGTNLVHTVTLSNESAVATTFSFTLAGNTASGTDFTGTPTFSNGVTLSGGNITVPAGVTSFTVTVPTTNDTIDESDETIDITVGGVAATGTIEDNDSAPTISSVSTESETEGSDLVHTVTLSNESAVATTFSFTLVGNTAAGTDFTGTPTFSNGVTLSGGNITVPAGVTSFTVTVSTTNDTIDESDETIDITVGGVAATGTIEDNDSAPTISSVTSESETEGTDLVHTVTLSNESAVATTFSFTLAGNTAAGTDFTGTPTFSNGVTLSGGNITVPAGVTSFTVTVPTTNDTIDESDETIDVTVGGVAATGTIEDNDSAPTISSVTSESETEGTNLVHTVTLSNESAVATTFSFTLAGNTASGTDFTGTPTFSNSVTLSGGNITVPAGVTSFTVTVPTTNDTIDESDETIDVTVGGVAATGTIEDNDAAPTISSVSTESETEGSDLVHTVTLSNESAVATTFSFTLVGNTAAGTDFTGTPTFSNGVTLSAGNITVPAGVTSFTVTVPTTNDTIDESDETIDLTVGGVAATGTIEDNDSAPTISSVTSESETEGTDLVHTVTLSNESAVATTFSFTLAGNTAAGTDFTGTPTFSNGVTLSGGNITVPAGVTSFTVTIPTTNDTIDESDETIDLTVGGVAATGTIEDNDSAPTISSVTSESETEGTDLVHTVTLSNESAVATTFSFTLAGNTAAGTDFTGTPTFSNGVTLSGGNITVPAGVTSFTVTIPTTNDTIDESGETIDLTVGGVAATGTIEDNDSAPTISSVTSESETEGTDLVHTVTLSNESAVATTFSFTLVGNTAAGTDFTGTPTFSNGVTLSGGNITVPAGVTSFTVTVPTTNDTIDESDETIDITVGGVAATGTIEDNDAAPTISSVSTESETEGTDLVHTVTLSNESAVATTFSFTLVGNTAAGTDFTGTPTFSNGVTLSGGNITVPAGVTSFTVTIPTTNDTIDESDETIDLTVGGVAATGTIEDNDSAPTISSVTSESETEGTDLVHTVTLSNESAVATTFSFTLVGNTAAGTDFTGTPTFSNGVTLSGGNITVPAGVTSFTVTVPTTNDTIDESDETIDITVGGVAATGTIEDNDAAPTISSVSTESETEGTDLVHTATLSNESAVATTFSFTLAGNTASGTDFTSTPTFSNGVTLSGGNITVPAGVTSFTVTVPTTNDTIDESDETIDLTVGGVAATGTIENNDSAPTISSVTSESETEGTDLVHTVTLSNESAVATTFSFTLAGNTASGTDFSSTPTFSNGVTLSGGNITVPAGVTSFTVTVPTTNDTIDESDETIDLTVGGVAATGTIEDNDSAPTISSVTSESETEGTDLVHTVTLSNESAVATTFSFTLAGNTAAGTDFTGTPTFSNGVTLSGGNITVPAGVTSFTVTVPTTNDTIDESDEIIDITVGGVAATGTIEDNDAAPTISSVTSESETEGTNLVHTVTLSNESAVATTFSFTLAGNTASGTDFTGTPTFSNGVTLSGGNITVPAGVTSFTVTVSTTNDTIDESDETIDLTVGGVAATGTIEDNDSAPTISSVTSESETEGTDLVHTVTLSNESAVATTFSFTLAGNTAAGTDFTGTPTFSNGVTLSGGNITVPAGVTSFTVTVPTTNDTIDESDETIDITVGGVAATGTIEDNDSAPTISSVTSESETEGTDLVHTVTLSNESAVATTFSFTLAGNTAAGTDFTGTPTFSNGVTLSGGNITVPAGVTSFTVTIPTTNDTIDESDETIDITVGGVAATSTIEDNDSAPTISSVSTESETEGTDLVHTVTLSNESAVATTFSFTLVGNTAAGSDFTGTPTFSNGVTLSGGNITVPAGVTSFTVTIPTTNDTIDESDETIDLTVGGVAATGTIEDNDSAPTISSVTSESETEGTDLVHTVTLSNESAVATTFSFALAGNTAAGSDFTGTPTFSNGVTLSGGNITVPAGVTSFTVTVPTTNDTIDESDETIDLTVGGVAATGTIEDNDSAPTISSVTSESETEGTDLVHTVTLSNESAVATTFSFTLAGNTAAGTDFTGTPTFSNGVTLSGGNITVPAGVTSFTVTVPTTNDTIDESDETIDITVGGVAATGTIEDNDSAPTISSVTSESETEGTDLIHTVTLSNESAVATTFSFTLAGNTAAGTDFTGTPTFSNGVTLSGGNITVPAGVTSFTVTVPTTNDTIDESDETIDLTVGGVAATGTIEDNDSAPTISSVTSESETEGTDLVHTVTLSNESAVATTFSFTLVGNTAAGTDFTGTPTFSNGVTLSGGNITVPAGVTSFTVTVPTTNDTIDESDETIDLTVGGVAATGTIEDNDSSPTISSVSTESETEGSDLVHTVTLSNESAVATTFSFTLAGNTAAGTDFTGTPTFSNGVTLSGGNITVPAGVTSFTVTVPTTNDTIDESDETIDLTVGGVAATGTIEDNDSAPTIGSVTSESETEGTDLVHTVTLSNESAVATTFSFTLAGNTAAGIDFTGTPTFSNGVTLSGGNITVPAGVTSFTVTVPTTNDTIDESDETIDLTVGGVAATGTIEDNDSAPTISSVTSESETEGTDLVHTVTLSNESAIATTFSFTLAGNTAAGTDFTGTPTFSNGVTLSGGNITVPAGVTSFTVTVPTTNDTIDESDETIDLTVGGVAATGTIEDNDSAPTISSVTSESETEGTDLVHTVTLSNESAVATTFSFALAGNTASGTDFTSTPTFSNGVTLSGGNITVPAGVTSFTVTVPTTNDTIDESDETIDLTVGGVAATGTIEDNDSAPTISSVTSESETEGTDLVHTVTLSNESAVATTFSFTLAGNTAAGTDFTSTPTFSNGVTLSGGNITVPAGVTSFTVTVPTTNDTINESDETIDLTVGGVAATGTIEDDDTPAVIGGTDTASVLEDNNVDISGNLTAAGTLTISDPDVGQSSFTAATGLVGTYGTLNINAAGEWTYTADNSQSAIQSLTPSDTIVDTIEITSFDGTTHDISISITGVNLTATDNTNTVDENARVTGNVISDGTADSDDTLSAGSILTTNLTLHYDASKDTEGDGIWENSSLVTPAPDFDWGFDHGSATTFTPSTITSALPGITEAYSFNVNGTDPTGAGFSDFSDGNDDSFSDITGDPTNNSASFEMWFRANDTTDHDLLFESGGATDGISIRINGTIVEFFVKDGGNDARLSFDLASVGIDPTAEFVQLVGVVTINGNVDLYINGALAAQDTSGLLADWSGSADAGLGVINNAINFDSPTAFEGDIAIFNFYESALTSANVLDNYQATAGFSVTHVNGSPISLLTPITLTNGTVIISGDGSYEYTPNSGFSGTETFTYTIENHNGDTDTGSITVTVDEAPTITSVTSESETEGTDLVHTVNLSHSSTADTVFSFSLVGNTATGTDFTNPPTFTNGVTLSGGNITVPAGVTSFTVTVPTTNDIIDEPDETIDLTIGGVAATGTIEDNDAAPTISNISDENEAEGNNLVHTVTLSNPSSIATTFAFSLVGDTATVVDDFTSPPTFSDGVTLSGGNITVPAGVTSFTVTIPTISDAINESTETITLTIGGSTATGTINDGAAIIGGVDTASLVEDTNLDSVGNLRASGVLTITDPDPGEDSFTAATGLTGTYGTLSINTAGEWSYTVDNSLSAIQSLTTSDTLIDTIEITSFDGSTHDITISISGVDLNATDNNDNTNENTPLSGNVIRDGIADTDDLISAGSIITTNLTLHYDASEDTEGDGIWDNTSATPPSPDFIWDFDASGTNFSPIDVSATTSLVGITEAYRFNVNPGDISGAGLSDQNGSDDAISNIGAAETNSATFEIWFRANDTSDRDVLFETGGTGDGTSIQINGTVVEFLVKDTNENVQLSFDLATIGIDPTEEFVQLTNVIDISGGNTTVSLYVNGTLAAQGSNALVLRWDGGNDAGLGSVNGNLNFNSPTAFEGEIAIFNFYESALSNANVLNNYQAIAGFSVTEVNGTAITLDTPMTLSNGTLIIAADGSYQYTPTNGFNGIETFNYTIENNNGDTETATISINVTNPIDGTTGIDTLTGTTDNDLLSGDQNNDTLIGGAGRDILFGGTGSDILTGGDDADTFYWQASDADTSTDSITDFTLGVYGVGDADIIDLADLLQNEESGLLSDFLLVNDNGTDVTISVDADGTGGYTDLTITIEGIGTGSIDLDTLISNSQLLIDT